MDRAHLLESYQAHIKHLTKVYQQSMDAHGLQAVAIHSGSLQKRSVFDDQHWPLRPVPAFQHWAPFPWVDQALVVPRTGAATLCVYRDKSYWERFAEPDLALLRSALNLVEVDSPQGVTRHLTDAAHTAFIGENLARAAEWGVTAANVNHAGLQASLDDLRVFKTPYEQLCLREANRMAAKGHARVAAEFEAGERSEFNLHLLYLKETGHDDGETPYKNIVAIGSSAAILHHISYRRDRLEGPQSLLVDAGAVFNGYASDITRTYVAKGGAEHALFGDLIGRMNAMQQTLCERATPGRGYETLHDETHERLAVILKDLDLVRMSPEAMVADGVTRMFLPHGLGHSLGLQCHDVGCARIKPRKENAWLRNTRVIEAGQCFTIEPGIYFIDTLMDELRAGPHGTDVNWKSVDSLKPFGGIRIEDDLVVRGGGQAAENLTRPFLP